MSHDVAPNLSTVILKGVEKVTGNSPVGLSRTPDSNHDIIYSQITPTRIAGEIENQLAHVQKSLGFLPGRERMDGEGSHWQEKFDLEMTRSRLKRARNTVNAIRFKGPTAFVSQLRRYSAADVLADCLVPNEEQYINDTVTKETNDKREDLKLHLAAALGNKDSIRQLKTQAEQRKDERQF